MAVHPQTVYQHGLLVQLSDELLNAHEYVDFLTSKGN